MDVDIPAEAAAAAAAGGAPPHADVDAAGAPQARLARLAGAVFGDPVLAAAVLSCLRMDEARPLRAAGVLTRDAVAAFPWDWRTQRPPGLTELAGGERVRRWRACFSFAPTVKITDGLNGQPVTDAHVALLHGVKDLSMNFCQHVTEAAFLPLAHTIQRLRIHDCSLSASVFVYLLGSNVQAVDVWGLRGPVTNYDLEHLTHVPKVLLDALDTDSASVDGAPDASAGVASCDATEEDADAGMVDECDEQPSIITDAGLYFLGRVRHLRVPFGGITPSGIATLLRLEALELLLPFGVRAGDVAWLLTFLPPTVTSLALLHGDINNSDYFEAHLTLPIKFEEGLRAPLSRLTSLRLEGLAEFSGELLHHAPNVADLRICDCVNVSANHFASLGRLRFLRIERCASWVGAAALQGLHALETLVLKHNWPGAHSVKYLQASTALLHVRFTSKSGNYDREVEVLQAFHGLGAGTFKRTVAAGEVVVSWTAALPPACPCCGLSGAQGGGCASWQRLRALKPPAGGGGGGWGEDDDDE
jgi:hypothetical protein